MWPSGRWGEMPSLISSKAGNCFHEGEGEEGEEGEGGGGGGEGAAASEQQQQPVRTQQRHTKQNAKQRAR